MVKRSECGPSCGVRSHDGNTPQDGLARGMSVVGLVSLNHVLETEWVCLCIAGTLPWVRSDWRCTQGAGSNKALSLESLGLPIGGPQP